MREIMRACVRKTEMKIVHETDKKCDRKRMKNGERKEKEK